MVFVLLVFYSYYGNLNIYFRNNGVYFYALYINQDARDRINKGSKPETAGELNYAISILLDDYLIRKGGIKYANINEAIGVLECAKLELYRRIAAPYEDHKISETGDVYRSPDL